MVASSLFSVPVAVILNQRLISQRGVVMRSTSRSGDTLRFMLSINSDPSSVRYGLTLQISALRNMSREHNLDQIPEHVAYIHFPTCSFFHYRSMTPGQADIQDEPEGELNIDKGQIHEIRRTLRLFWVNGEDLHGLRHLIVKCDGAVVGSNTIPKLRSACLEWELKRIFGTVKTANELENACLELDCLLPAMGGGTDRALAALRDAALKDLLVREVQKNAGETDQLNKSGFNREENGQIKNTKLKNSYSNSNLIWKNRSDITKVEMDGESKRALETKNKENTPKKPFIPVIIDGHFVSSNRHSDMSLGRTSKAKNITAKTSPSKYPHARSSNPGKTEQALEMRAEQKGNAKANKPRKDPMFPNAYGRLPMPATASDEQVLSG